MTSLFVRCLFFLGAVAFLQGCSTQPAREFGAGYPARSDMTAPVPRFEVFEVTLRGAVSYSNAYTDVSVQVTFVAPDGRELNALAFHDGDNVWRARIAPDVVGHWTYRSSASRPDEGLHDIRGQFDCVASNARGFIRVDTAAKYHFSFSDGTPFYGVGDTAYGLTSGVSDQQLVGYLDKRQSQHFNFVRLFASGFPDMAHHTLPASQTWPWGGTREQPDFDRINPQYFQRLEQVIAELKLRGMNAEILVFNYYSMPFIDPAQWTAAREQLWAGQVIARLAASTNVFLWTVTNEYETYPQGRYKYDGATDDDWARSMGALFHRLDPHRHPTTVHNFTFDRDGGVGGRFGHSADLDVISHQSWGNGIWQGKYLQGDAGGIEPVIAVDRTYDKPVINTENGYEWLPAHSNFNRQTASNDKVRRAAWRIFMSGAAAYASGFGGTWHGSDNYVWKGDGPLYFRLRDMGLGAQISHLQQFISQTALGSLNPADCVTAPNLCLAAQGREYVVYLPAGGEVAVDLSKHAGVLFNAAWFNPRNGAYRKLPPIAGGGELRLRRAGKNDWVLQLKVATE